MQIYPEVDRVARPVIALTPYVFFFSMFPFVAFNISVVAAIIASYAGIAYMFLFFIVLPCSIPIGCAMLITGIWYMVFKILRDIITVVYGFSNDCLSYTRSILDRTPILSAIVRFVQDIYRNGFYITCKLLTQRIMNYLVQQLICTLLYLQRQPELQYLSVIRFGVRWAFSPFRIFLTLGRSVLFMLITLVGFPRRVGFWLATLVVSEEALHLGIGETVLGLFRRTTAVNNVPAASGVRRTEARVKSIIHLKDQETGEIVYCRIHSAKDGKQLFVHSYGILPQDILLLLVRDYLMNGSIDKNKKWFRENFEIPVVFTDAATKSISNITLLASDGPSFPKVNEKDRRNLVYRLKSAPNIRGVKKERGPQRRARSTSNFQGSQDGGNQNLRTRGVLYQHRNQEGVSQLRSTGNDNEMLVTREVLNGVSGTSSITEASC
jgi:hypothetical protein